MFEPHPSPIATIMRRSGSSKKRVPGDDDSKRAKTNTTLALDACETQLHRVEADNAGCKNENDRLKDVNAQLTEDNAKLEKTEAGCERRKPDSKPDSKRPKSRLPRRAKPDSKVS